MTKPSRRGNNPANAAQGRAKALPFLCSPGLRLAEKRRSGVTQDFPSGLPRETRTAFQYSACRRRGFGRSGACSYRAHAAAQRTARHRISAELCFHSRRAMTARMCSTVHCRVVARMYGPLSPITLIHASWTHLGVNAVCGYCHSAARSRAASAPLRFLAFFAVTAAAGAALHLATHAGEQFPMIGASAAISGTMAAAMRFAFQRGGPLGMLGRADDSAYRVPAIPLRGMVRDPRVLLFLGGLVRHQHPVRNGVIPDDGRRSAGRLAGAYRRLSGRAAAVFVV